jgi:hypothetical protein
MAILLDLVLEVWFVGEWLSIDAIALLDAALCIKIFRDQFVDTLRQSRVVARLKPHWITSDLNWALKRYVPICSL